ncbi:MAG: hypothetical protein GC155_13395 [Alphaproteobacteria bacterium]|nr:hypothetical protein [Alphaproteobacteria bacterium]
MRSLVLCLIAGIAPQAMSQTPHGDLSGLLDLRVGAGGGETSWLDGGFGKLGLGGEDDLDARIARGALVWRPHLTWSTDLYLQLEFDPEQDNPVGVGEAYLRFKPMPAGSLRYSLKVGAFYPPVSLENDGVAWSTSRTLTPSAINTWIGEEVKVGGLETSVTMPAGAGHLTATGAAFGYNDTAGTLLTFRGWAMHDHQINLGGEFPLPERTPAWWALRPRQAHVAEPFREIDGRVGYYAQLEWRPAAPFAASVLHYDNNGDGHSRDDFQTSWDTAFTNVSVIAQLGENTQLLAQAMLGETAWIPLANGPVAKVDDVGFRSAYILLDHAFGGQGLAARLEAFETTDENQPYSLNSTPENGWAVTASWRNHLTTNLIWMVEGVYVESNRDARSQVGVDPDQNQLQLQTALRVNF